MTVPPGERGGVTHRRVSTPTPEVLGGRRFTTDVERVLFAMVANRAIDPMCKLATAEWATYDVALPGIESMDDDQAYRAMDLLVAADAQAEVQEAVFFAVADLLNLEVDLLFFDTTSTYFERDTEDDGDDGFRRYGHSKDHRPDLPQIVIGLAVTREGIPVRVWCWPGNTNDQTVLPEVQRRAAGLAAGAGRDRRGPRVLLRRQPGLPAPRRRALDRRGTHARRLPRRRRSAAPARAATSRCATTCGSRKSASSARPDRRWIVCHNPVEAERDQATRDAAIARLEAELATIAAGPGPRRRPRQEDQAKQGLRRGAPPRRVRAARPPHPRPLPPPDRHRPPRHRPLDDPRRATPRRQVPAVHLATPT